MYRVPLIDSNQNTCQKCGNHLLPPKLAATGTRAGQYYLNCFKTASHPDQMAFWFWFAPGVAPSNVSMPSPSGTILHLPQAAPVSGKCALMVCSSHRVHGSCKNKMCRRHCMAQHNGCTVKTHSAEIVSDRQQSKMRAQDTDSSSHPLQVSTLPSTVLEPGPVGDFLDSFSMPEVYLQMDDVYSRQLQEREDREFELNIGWSPSLVPAPIPAFDKTAFTISDEDMDLLTTMQLSLSPQLNDSDIPLEFTHMDISTASSLVPRATSSKVPQVRVPAVSVVAKQPAPLKMTRQMSDTWMCEYTDNTATPPTQAKGSCRPFADLSVVRRFILVYWDQDDVAAQIHCIQECPEWPNWKLSTAPGTLNMLSNELAAIEVYSKSLYCWMRVGLDYTHILTTDRHILIRRCGVIGSDEAEQIWCFLSPPELQHLRYNLPAERTAVRAGIRSCKLLKDHHVAIAELSDEEVEFVSTSRGHTKRRLTEEPQIDSRPVRHRRMELPPLGSSADPITIHSPTPPLPFPSPHSKWPAGMYAVDMVEGFDKMKDPHLLAKLGSQAALFEHVYGCPFKVLTFNDQKLQWSRADPLLCQTVLDAGHAVQGL